MAQRPELVTSEQPMMSGQSPQLALARIISFIFSPPLTAIASYVLILLNSADTTLTNLRWILLSLSIQLLPVTALYIWRLRRGDYHDPDVSNRRDRNELYLLGSISLVITIALLVVMHAPVEYIALAVGTMAIGICFGFVNLFWKISMHAAGIASLTAISLFYLPILGIVMFALLILVAWARVRTRNHTLLQVLAGALLAGILMYVSFISIVFR